MDRCDFSSVMKIITTYIRDDAGIGQLDLMYLLFADCLKEHDPSEFDLDKGQVSRWISGQARVSPIITGFYQDKETLIAEQLSAQLLSKMSDPFMAGEQLNRLIMHDLSISGQMRESLSQLLPCRKKSVLAAYVARIIVFGMSRDFVPRNHRTRLLADKSMSPSAEGYIFGCDIPAPCRFFCGRDHEIAVLHEKLESSGKVFLSGIGGLGKSELAKAYAKHYRKDYTNILYIQYSGSLYRDILNLDFADDASADTEPERYQKHGRYLRSLNEDTLIVIDNFNTTAYEEKKLPEILRLKCRILFTTRSRFDDYTELQLTEMKNREDLFTLFSHYYSHSGWHKNIILKIIDSVHHHTMAVELSARLLQNGIIKPKELLQKLQAQKTGMDSVDQITFLKDNTVSRETYRQHIHLLFSLCSLQDAQQYILRNMSLIPIFGIPASVFAQWLQLSDMNDVNKLVDMGLIARADGSRIYLHPLIQEECVTDLKPSLDNCRMLCDTIQYICLHHGLRIAYHKTVTDTARNIAAFTEKTDLPFYLRFLEDVHTFNLDYPEYPCSILLSEMDRLLQDPSFGTVNDRALLLYFKALDVPDRNPAKVLQFLQKASTLLENAGVSERTALLASNILHYLGSVYYTSGDLQAAQHYLRKAYTIVTENQLEMNNDVLIQNMSLALLLCDVGDITFADALLTETQSVLTKANVTISPDAAFLEEAMGCVKLYQRNLSEAERHFEKAIEMHKLLYSDNPERLKQREALLRSMLAHANMNHTYMVPVPSYGQLIRTAF